MGKPMTRSTRLFLIIAAGAVIAALLYAVLVIAILARWEVRGQFGDMFGALNALFSGLAFAGVIYAVILQRQELELQRLELKSSTEAQREQAQALSRAAELNVESASLECIAMRIRHLKKLVREHGSSDVVLEDAVKESIDGLEEEMQGIFARIGELRESVRASAGRIDT